MPSKTANRLSRSNPPRRPVAGTCAARFERVGHWVDGMLGHVDGRKYFATGQRRYRRILMEAYETAREHGAVSAAAALHVVQQGLMHEPLREGAEDNRGTYRVEGWFPRAVIDRFTAKGELAPAHER